MKKISTVYKKFNYQDYSNSRKYLEYKKNLELMKGKAKEIVASTITMKVTEHHIVKEFCNENNISLTELLLLLLYRDSAISNELLTALKDIYPRTSLKYLTKKDFTFNYKENYSQKNWDKVLEKDANKRVSLNLKYIVNEEIKKYYKDKGYISFTQYIKDLINDLTVYPSGLYDALKAYIRTDFIMNPDENHMLHLDKERERQAKRRQLRTLDLNSEKVSTMASLSLSIFEKEELIDPFLKYLKEQGLNLKKLIVYELMKENIYTLEETKLTKKDIVSIENLNYKVQNPLRYKLSYENALNENKGKKSVMFSLPNSNKLKEFFKGKLGTWIKYKVFRAYSVYPIVNDEDISTIFINQFKLKSLNII